MTDGNELMRLMLDNAVKEMNRSIDLAHRSGLIADVRVKQDGELKQVTARLLNPVALNVGVK